MLNIEEPASKTCPQYFQRLPWIRELSADVEDYRRGALGNVDEMSAVRLELFRVLDGEMGKWKSENDHRVEQQCKAASKKK